MYSKISLDITQNLYQTTIRSHGKAIMIHLYLFCFSHIYYNFVSDSFIFDFQINFNLWDGNNNFNLINANIIFSIFTFVTCHITSVRCMRMSVGLRPSTQYVCVACPHACMYAWWDTKAKIDELEASQSCAEEHHVCWLNVAVNERHLVRVARVVRWWGLGVEQEWWAGS